MPIDQNKLSGLSKALAEGDWHGVKAAGLPFSPPDGDASVATPTTTTPVPAHMRRIQTGNFIAYTKTVIADIIDRIAFIRLVEDAKKKGSVSFEMKSARELKTTASRQGWIPIWWLPWDSRGALVELSIPSVKTMPMISSPGIDPVFNPPVFFTAALSGCSIFVKGANEAPIVAHAGRDGGIKDEVGQAQFDQLGGTSEAFWRNIFNGVTYDTGDLSKKTGVGVPIAPMTPTPTAPGNFKEVNLTNYVTGVISNRDGDTVTQKRLPAGDTFQGRHFEQFLKNKYGKMITGIWVSPYGAVFGMRAPGGTWAFHLQRNTTVMYKRLRKTSMFKKDSLAPVEPALTESFCFGDQQFFPGAGVYKQTSYDTFQLSS